jgi:hypothetical protein
MSVHYQNQNSRNWLAVGAFGLLSAILVIGFMYTATLYTVKWELLCGECLSTSQKGQQELFALTEYYIGRYTVVPFGLFVTAAFFWGVGQMITGSGLMPLLKSLLIVACYQFVASSFEFIRGWPAPADANVFASMVFLPFVNYFGLGTAQGTGFITLFCWLLISLIPTTIVAEVGLGIPLIHTFIIPSINAVMTIMSGLGGHDKKKVQAGWASLKEILSDIPRILTSQSSEILQGGEEDGGVEGEGLGGFPTSKNVPVLDDVVEVGQGASGGIQKFPPDYRPSRKANRPAMTQQPQQPRQKVVVDNRTGAITPQAVEDALRTVGLEADNTTMVVGPIVARVLFNPQLDRKTAVLSKWKAAAPIINTLLKLPSNTVAFRDSGHGLYAYDITLPEESRRPVMFKDLITKYDQGLVMGEEGVVLPVIVGLNVSGEKVIIRCVFSLMHIFISGKTGSGKSMLLHSLLISVMRNALKTKQPIQLWFSDMGGATSARYKPLLGSIVAGIANDPQQTIKLLKKLTNIWHQRMKLLDKYSVDNIALVNKQLAQDGQPQHPLIILVIDEISALMNSEHGKGIGKTLSDLVTTARKIGVFLWSSGTYMTKGDMGTGSAVLAQSKKISFQMNPIEARNFGGEGFPAHTLANCGDMYLKSDGTCLRAHSPIFDKDMGNNLVVINKWIAALSKAAAARGIRCEI